MPFVQRVVQPIHVSRVILHDDEGKPRIKDGELEAVTNYTLSSALRQLASVVVLADEIFKELNKQLHDVTERTKNLRIRIDTIDEKVASFDPKTVTVPVSDLTIFSGLKNHFKSQLCQEKGLFTEATRSNALRRLYEEAAPTPVPVVRQLDRYRRDGLRCSRFFSVTPILGGKRRRANQTSEIETRTPAVVSNMRMWTSMEALGDVTVDPDCTHRVAVPELSNDIDHRLPSPEEQVQAVALKFPAEVVPVDISGRSFNRMSAFRRSLMHVECEDSRRRSKHRRSRGKRRNTIAGTDVKELAATVWSSISSGSTCQKHGRRNPMVSTSSSVTSESTLTPDDGETCSMYSCDTEGYYTSFHMDSGLKTLREEDPLPAMQSSSALSGSRNNNSSLTADSEYELFGKGSTSTTASSAGTVCTTLLIPPPIVPERISSQLTTERNVKSLGNLSSKELTLKKETSSFKSDKKSNTDPCRGRNLHEIKRIESTKSNLTKENITKLKDEYNSEMKDDTNCMITVEVHHEGTDSKTEKCGDSPDSGHNTCSSPVDSVTSPSLDLEMSECSDLEGVDRVERIRVKTTINSSRIPSMCVITPPQSDDEVSLNAMRTATDSGDYVTIADVRQLVPTSPVLTRESEYVSLNELPATDSLEKKKRLGARVTLDSEGKVVYSSDSLRRRKAIHTTGTFEPGPHVATTSSPVLQHRVTNVRPVITSNSPILKGNRKPISPTLTQTTQKIISNQQNTRPLSPLVTSDKNTITCPASPVVNKPVQNDSNEKTVTSDDKPPSSPSLTASPQRKIGTSNQKQYFPKSSYGRMSPVVNSSRPLSPLILLNQTKVSNIKSNIELSSSPPSSPVKSPAISRPLSPRMVVRANLSRAVSPNSPRGAYVKVQDSLGQDEDGRLVVKRSDSYRLANDETKDVFNPNTLGRRQYGANVIVGPKLLNVINNNQANKESLSTEQLEEKQPKTPSPQTWQGTWPQGSHSGHQSSMRSSTPTKPNTPQMNLTGTLSPIQRSSTPTPTGRTPMDLYAIIHESKKKIMRLRGRHSPPVECDNPKDSQAKTVPNWPKCIPNTQLRAQNVSTSDDHFVLPPNGQYQRLSPSPTPLPSYPDRSQNRASPDHCYGNDLKSCLLSHSLTENDLRNTPTQYQSVPNKNLIIKTPLRRNLLASDRKLSPQKSPERPLLSPDRRGVLQSMTRNDFKQLLLRTGCGSNTAGKPSAVERLKNKTPMPAPSPQRKTWKSDVLSSTILEDCDEDEEQFGEEIENDVKKTAEIKNPNLAIPKSSALVNQQCKAFQARSSPTLETAL
ncbi:NHS actin remodeling regulator GUK-holder isoform X2 [Lycorma delicatula]|uniref:NHS actin remodeling regulator GUK-holder isoform X2 n=1 Tax=Lycorma delicatula TaxID=130591 RepID=UPI003F50FA8F